MITFGNINLAQIHVSKFDPSSAKPTKHILDPIVFSQSVSTSGSIFNLSLSNNLSISQLISDFYSEPLSNTLSLSDLVVTGIERPLSLSHSMLITDSFIFTGTAGNGGGGNTPIEAIFDSNTDQGMVIYIVSDTNVDLAKSDVESTSGAVGLANADVVALVAGNYITEGQIEKSDWTSVVGSTLLTPGAVYFLSKDSPGLMTTTPPSVAGEYVVRVGRAISNMVFDIEISQPILL